MSEIVDAHIVEPGRLAHPPPRLLQIGQMRAFGGAGDDIGIIIASGAVPVVRLTEVFRQAARSRIVTSAHGINRGAIPNLSKPEGDSDFYFVQADDPETAVPTIIELVKTRIPKRFGLDPVRDIQVLCPMNRGGAGARSLNIELQATLNPAGERKVERFGWTFAPGEKVMQIENDYDKEVYSRIRLVAAFAARCRREDAPRSVRLQFVVLDHLRLDDAGV